jgi:hypothetical protein
MEHIRDGIAVRVPGEADDKIQHEVITGNERCVFAKPDPPDVYADRRYSREPAGVPVRRGFSGLGDHVTGSSQYRYRPSIGERNGVPVVAFHHHERTGDLDPFPTAGAGLDGVIRDLRDDRPCVSWGNANRGCDRGGERNQC